MPAPDDAAALLRLQHQLAYHFTSAAWLEQALTHSAVAATNNQRLEFLGDAVLALVLSGALLRDHPGWDEGALSVARTALVRKETLADLAGRLGLGSLLRVRREVARSGPVQAQPAVLADACEALIGAVFLDGGYAAAEQVVLRLFQPLLAAADGSAALARKDAKTRLQEALQAQGRALPMYRLLATTGPAHALTFQVEGLLPSTGLSACGTGASRKLAEQDAAGQLLLLLEQVSRP